MKKIHICVRGALRKHCKLIRSIIVKKNMHENSEVIKYCYVNIYSTDIIDHVRQWFSFFIIYINIHTCTFIYMLYVYIIYKTRFSCLKYTSQYIIMCRK